MQRLGSHGAGFHQNHVQPAHIIPFLAVQKRASLKKTNLCCDEGILIAENRLTNPTQHFQFVMKAVGAGYAQRSCRPFNGFGHQGLGFGALVGRIEAKRTHPALLRTFGALFAGLKRTGTF